MNVWGLIQRLNKVESNMIIILNLINFIVIQWDYIEKWNLSMVWLNHDTFNINISEHIILDSTIWWNKWYVEILKMNGTI